MPKFQRPLSLTNLARDKIRDGIKSGQYPLGSALYVGSVAEQFGISVTPVREAFVQLQMEGLLEVIPHSGTFVFNPTAKNIEDMLECRFVLEKAALEFAFKRNRRRLLTRLEKTITSMRAAVDADDGEKYREWDAEFHKAFFSFCENVYLGSSYSLMEAKIAALRVYVTIPRPSEVSSSYSEHVLILSHLKEGDLRQAFNVLEVHISRAGALYPLSNKS